MWVGGILGKKIAMISALGGQGCTLSAAYVGNAMAESGRSVTMIDLCGFGGTLAYVMGAAENAAMNLGDVIRGACACEDALLECGFPALRVMPPWSFSEVSISPYSADCIQIIQTLSRDSDVICDLPPGVVPSIDAIRCFDMFAVCALADSLSLKYTAALCRVIKNLAADCGASCEVRLLLSRFTPEYMRSFGISDIDECINTVGAKLLGIVPYDSAAARAASDGKAPSALCDAMRFSRDIAARICGEKVPLESKRPMFL